MRIEDAIEKTINGEDLSKHESKKTLKHIFDGSTDTQIGSLLTALRMKGETEEEIAGFAEAMIDEAKAIDPDKKPLIDTCGTGGDGYDTINISTASSIVAAASGAGVAKHGNYSVSSKSGSADVLEELGVEIGAEPEKVESAIEQTGIGFLLAPVFHPAMKRVIGPRKELGIRTVFNILGPLSNPADVDGQVVGVYDPELVPLMGRVLSLMDTEKALVVHGSGLDEICLHGESKVAEVTGENIREYSLTPSDLGLEEHTVSEISGGTASENAKHLKKIFSGDETGAKRDIVLANTGAALYSADLASDIKDGVEMARNSIKEGKAREKLEALRSHQ